MGIDPRCNVRVGMAKTSGYRGKWYTLRKQVGSVRMPYRLLFVAAPQSRDIA